MYLHDWEKATPFLEGYKVGDRSLKFCLYIIVQKMAIAK